MDFDVIAYSAAIVDDRVTPDADIVSDKVFLPDDHIMTCPQIGANGATTVDRGARTNASSGTNAQGAILTAAGRVAERYPIINCSS